MIKFVVEQDKRKLIGLGLSAENISKLQEGRPIQIMGEEITIPNMDILIFFGETEQKMEELLKKYGLITDTTKVSIGIGTKH
jgi:hypothetical protein